MKKILSQLFKRKWLLLLIVVLIAGGYFWYTKRQPKTVYTTVNPQYTDLTETLNVSGAIDAYEKVDLKFGAPAKLAWVGVKEGQTVKKYQAIATQDTQTLKKQLQLSLNNFAKQFITHDETLDKYDYYNNPSVDLELKRILEKAQYDLDNAVVQVEIADLAVKLSTLSTPIAGVVTHVAQPLPGNTIGLTDTYQVVNPDTIYFSSIVDEADIAKVAPGQQVQISLDAFPDQTFNGTVQRIDFASSTSESGGVGYTVYISFPEKNSEMKYRLGMNGTADVVLNKKSQVLAIPLDSLISRDNKNYVDVLENGTAVRKEIGTGIETDTQVEVTSGLQPNELVIVPQAP